MDPNDTNSDVTDVAAVTPEVTPSTTEGGDNGFNPAWNPLLEKLPTEFHHIVAPTLREWDTGVQKRFEQVQSKFKPYEQFAEQNVAPDDIQVAMQVANLLQTNPRFVYDKMMEQYGEEWGLNSDQGFADEGTDEFETDENGQVYDLENDPRFQQTQQQLQALTQLQQAQIEQQAREKIDAEINRDFEAVSQKHGQLSQEDIDMIISVSLSQQVPLTQAADKVFSYRGVQQAQQQQNSLPNVVPPGGGMPSQAVNPANLDNKSTRNLVEGILRNANQQT
jgi:hypothetical protein